MILHSEEVGLEAMAADFAEWWPIGMGGNRPGTAVQSCIYGVCL